MYFLCQFLKLLKIDLKLLKLAKLDSVSGSVLFVAMTIMHIINQKPVLFLESFNTKVALKVRC